MEESTRRALTASGEPTGGLGAAAWLDHATAADVLARARIKLGDHADPAVSAIASLAEDVVTRWRRRLDELDAAWSAAAEAENDASELQRMAAALLRTLQELAANRWRHTGDNPGLTPSAAPRDDPVVVPPHHEAFEVRLFGPFQIVLGDRCVEAWHSAKAARLVRYLFAQAPRQIGREALIELFWTDCDAEAGRRGLHQAIYQIRRALRDSGCDAAGVVYGNETYGIDPDLGYLCDVVEFERLLERARSRERDADLDGALEDLHTAEGLYRGDLLEDCPHEEWVLYERDRLRMRYVAGANHLAELLAERGDHDEAFAVSQGILAREPADEAAHRRTIACFVQRGQRSLAIRQYQSCTEALQRSFGVEPAPETTRLYRLAVEAREG